MRANNKNNLSVIKNNRYLSKIFKINRVFVISEFEPQL